MDTRIAQTPGSRRHHAKSKMDRKQTDLTLARSLTQPTVTDGLSLTAQREKLQVLKGSMQQAHEEFEQRAGMTKKMSTQGLPQYRLDAMKDNHSPALSCSFVDDQEFSKSTVAPGNIQSQPTKPSSKIYKSSTSDKSSVPRRVRANANAKLITKVSSQPPTEQHTKISFNNLMARFDADKALQSKSSPTPTSNGKLSGQSPTFRRVVTDFTVSDGEPDTVPESFVQQHSPASLVKGKDKPLIKTQVSGSSPLFNPSMVNGVPFTAKVQPQSSPAPPQQPVPVKTTQLPSDDNVVPKSSVVAASPSQISDRIDSYIVDALGEDLDDHVHNIFKKAMLTASLWTLQDKPTYDHLISTLNTQIKTNERNARAANKSLEAALDSYNLKDTSLSLEAIEHYKLLDTQEKQRQDSLERLLVKFKENEPDIVKTIKQFEEMKDKLSRKDDDNDSVEDCGELPETARRVTFGSFKGDKTDVDEELEVLAKVFNEQHVFNAAKTRERKRIVDFNGINIMMLD
ncbi:hypothetical protein E4T39_04964 [Aureobasidium subglaciale]|nr:hypothetical protein E4T39_04964 [Aureobasidium subglaciale]